MLSRATDTDDASNTVAVAHVEAPLAQWKVEVDPLRRKSDDQVMANQAIGKGVWHAPDSTGYIGLDLTDDIPRQKMRTVEGIELSPKREYHCSLVDVHHYIKDPKKEQLIADGVHDFLRTHALQYAGLGDERYLCRKEDRVTVVAPVRIDGIDEFVAFVQTLIQGYEPPFLHVTLLKSATAEHGISVSSLDDFDLYCERLPR